MKKITLSIFCLLCFQSLSHAQNAYRNQSKSTRFYMGLGVGIAYGGIGAKFEYLPLKHLGVMGGLGFNFLGPGLNAGVSYKILPDKKVEPVINLLFGYNAVINISGYGGISKTYYGVSPGLGLEWKVGKRENKLSFSLYLPVRSEQFHEDYESVKNNPSIDLETEISPVLFSVGFNWAI